MPGPHHEFSGPALVERAVEDSVNDPSFIVAMDMRSKSNQTRGRITISGSGDCEGRLFRGRDGTMEILRKDGQAYLRPDETMLRTPGKDGIPAYSQAEAALVKGKWIKVPKADKEGNAVFDLCDFKKLIHEGYDPDLRYERAGTFKIRGTRTARVTAKDSGSQVTYYIAGNPSPRLWRLELSGPEGTGYLAVTDYYVPFFPQEPPAGQVVDLSKQR
ncbi:hypothetical protein ACFQ61_31560 [Streptomyces sp. NPDC056500]|uniref:hypothetical protein n=1 Tax=Streptomyces sp. NPDC056500 TaxID=3345840 RepID=UPI00368756EC